MKAWKYHVDCGKSTFFEKDEAKLGGWTTLEAPQSRPLLRRKILWGEKGAVGKCLRCLFVSCVCLLCWLFIPSSFSCFWGGWLLGLYLTLSRTQVQLPSVSVCSTLFGAASFGAEEIRVTWTFRSILAGESCCLGGNCLRWFRHIFAVCVCVLLLGLCANYAMEQLSF